MTADPRWRVRTTRYLYQSKWFDLRQDDITLPGGDDITYTFVEHPGYAREVEIIRRRADGVPERLARLVAAAVEQFRGLGLYKPPGVAESIDWAQALFRLGATELSTELVDASLGTVLKYREDLQRVREHGIDTVVEAAVARAG